MPNHNNRQNLAPIFLANVTLYDHILAPELHERTPPCILCTQKIFLQPNGEQNRCPIIAYGFKIMQMNFFQLVPSLRRAAYLATHLLAFRNLNTHLASSRLRKEPKYLQIFELWFYFRLGQQLEICRAEQQ